MKKKTTKVKKIHRIANLPHSFKRQLLDFLTAGFEVHIDSFGIFSIVNIPARTTYHNFSGELVTVKPYKKLKFSQSHELKEWLSTLPKSENKKS